MRSSLHRLASMMVDDYLGNGQLQPGDQLPSVRDLRKKYGTSVNTVVHALSLLEEQGVIEKRYGVGCFVTGQKPSSSSRTQELKIFGFVGPFTNSELAVAACEGVEKTCRKHGYHMVMASTDNDYEAERDQIRRMSEAGCAAVVLTPTPRTRKQLQTDYLRSEFLDLPIVLLDAAYPEQKRSQVVFDNYSAGYEMTRLLLREGHKRIAFIELNTAEGDLLYRSVADRRRGYMDAVGEAGLPLVKEDIWTLCVDPVGSDADIPRSVLKRLPEEMYPEVIPLMDRWARLEDRPTAVIALEDTVASQLVNIAMEMGITIPDQLQIVGFDNTIAGRTCRPSFPTTDPDFARAGQMAAEIAFQHLRGSTREQTIYVLPAPIRRRKTALHQTKSVASRHMVASGA